jgi:hypothetical protein
MSAIMPNGITLNYEVHGTGESLLLINGRADDTSARMNQLIEFPAA